MIVRCILILYIIINFILLSIFIYKKEYGRIKSIIEKYKSPINKIKITLFDTYLKSKKELYIRIFADNDVIAHEVAHSLCSDIGHTDEFYKIYKSLTNKSFT